MRLWLIVDFNRRRNEAALVAPSVCASGIIPQRRICMDHHIVAAVSITGTCLDVLGSLYLAYDLLGGQHGPLRVLTRAVTYALVFGIGYGVGLGPFFGIVAGL